MWPHRFRFCVFKEYLLKLILRRYIVSLFFMDSSIHNFESLVKGISDDYHPSKSWIKNKNSYHSINRIRKMMLTISHFDKTPIFQSPIFDAPPHLKSSTTCGSMDGWPKTIGRQCKPRSPNGRFTLKIPRKINGESIEPKAPIFVGLLCYITFCALVFDMQNDYSTLILIQ